MVNAVDHGPEFFCTIFPVGFEERGPVADIRSRTEGTPQSGLPILRAFFVRLNKKCPLCV
jgi:hypothetical protein